MNIDIFFTIALKIFMLDIKIIYSTNRIKIVIFLLQFL